MKKKIKIKNKKKVLKEDSPWWEADHPDHSKFLCADPSWSRKRWESLPEGFCKSKETLLWIAKKYGIENAVAAAKAADKPFDEAESILNMYPQKHTNPKHKDYKKFLCIYPDHDKEASDKLSKEFCESPEVVNWVEDNYGLEIRTRSELETALESEEDEGEKYDSLEDDEDYENEEDKSSSIEAKKTKVINHTAEKIMKNQGMVDALTAGLMDKIDKIAAVLFSFPFISKIFDSPQEISSALSSSIIKNKEQVADSAEAVDSDSKTPSEKIQNAAAEKKSKYAKKELKISGSLKDKIIALEPIIKEASDKHNVKEELIKAVIYTESNFQPDVVSSAGAVGLMQLMPSTARNLGVNDSFDPRENIMGGTKFLSSLINGSSIERKFTSESQKHNLPFEYSDLTECQKLRLALYCYNAGIRGVLGRGIGKSALKNLNNKDTTAEQWFDIIVEHYRSKSARNAQKEPTDFDYSLKTINFANNLGANYCMEEGTTTTDAEKQPTEKFDGNLSVALIGSEISAFSPGSSDEEDKSVFKSIDRKNFLGITKESLDFVEIVENIGVLNGSLDTLESDFLLNVSSKEPDVLIIQPGSIKDAKQIFNEGADGLLSRLLDIQNKAPSSIIVVCTIPASKSLGRYIARSSKYDEAQKKTVSQNVHEKIQDFNNQVREAADGGKTTWITLDIAGIVDQEGAGELKNGMSSLESRGIFINSSAHAEIAKSLGNMLTKIRKNISNDQEADQPENKIEEGFKNFFNSLVDR